MQEAERQRGKRRRIDSFFSLLLCFSASLLLNPNSGYATNNAVMAIQSTYRSTEDISADFTQSTYIDVLGSTVKENGVFMMKKPGKLFIEYTGEHPKRYISNGKKLWVVDKELSQVEVYSVNKDSMPKEALEFLKGFGDMEKLFTAEDMNTEKPKAGETYLKLTPRSKNQQYKWLGCLFGPDNILKRMTIYNKSGNVSTYVFSNIKLNQGLKDDIFQFKTS